jgi:hypothetical protein
VPLESPAQTKDVVVVRVRKGFYNRNGKKIASHSQTTSLPAQKISKIKVKRSRKRFHFISKKICFCTIFSLLSPIFSLRSKVQYFGAANKIDWLRWNWIGFAYATSICQIFCCVANNDFWSARGTGGWESHFARGQKSREFAWRN